MKFGQAFKDINKYGVTGQQAIEMLEKENAYIQGMLNHGYTDAGLADEQMAANDKTIELIIRNDGGQRLTNNKGVNVMTILKTTTKDELRSELLKYGVEFSNTKFGKVKRQELIDQLM